MKAILTGGLLLLGACGGAPFSVESADPTVPTPTAASAASSAPTPATSAAPSASASAPDSGPAPIGTALVPAPTSSSTPPPAPAPDAGPTLGNTSSLSDAGAPDACDQSTEYTHQNGFGGQFHDCIPGATYAPADVGIAEALKACNSSPFSNGNTCYAVTDFCALPYVTNMPVHGLGTRYDWVVGWQVAGKVSDTPTGYNVYVETEPGSAVCNFSSPASTWN